MGRGNARVFGNTQTQSGIYLLNYNPDEERYNYANSKLLQGALVKKIRPFSVSKIALALALAALVVMLCFAVANYFKMARLALSFPYPLDYGEGPILDQVLRVASGENIYHNDFSKPPFNISNYPPLYLLAQVPFAKIFGPALWYGRGISFLSALLAALFIGLTLYTLTGDRLSAVFGGLMLLAFPYIQFWSLLNRIDTLALALSWVAVFIAVRWPDRRWGIPLAAAFFVASVYTRQTYALAGPAGAFFWLISTRRWRKAIELAVIVGGAGLLIFGLANLLTRGGFYLNIVKANVNPYIMSNLKWNWEKFYQHCYFLMGAAVLFVLVERFTWHNKTWPLVLPYLVGGVATALTIGKDGSNVNYLYELAAALSLVTGAAVAWLKRYTWLQAAMLFVVALQVGIMLPWTQADFNGNVTGKTDNRDSIAQLYKIVRDTDGIVLTDEYMGLVPLAGKRLYFQPFEFKMLAEAGLWDQNPFLEQIVSHKFSTILWFDPPNWDSIKARWTYSEQSAINSSYILDDIIATTQILHPRK